MPSALTNFLNRLVSDCYQVERIDTKELTMDNTQYTIENHTSQNWIYKGVEYQPVAPISRLRIVELNEGVHGYSESVVIEGEPKVQTGVLNVLPLGVAHFLWSRGRTDIIAISGYASSDWLQKTPEVKGFLGTSNMEV